MAYLVQEETWLQRHSRLILTILAGLGSFLTAYLTFTKLTEQTAAFCTGDGGCDLVLSSRWATFLGVPTALLGFLGFVGVVILAQLPDSSLVKKWRWPALFGLVTAMVSFELYMAYLMVGVLKQFCLYCTMSILLVAGLGVVTLFGYRWLDLTKLVFNFILISLVTLITTIGVYANQTPPASPFARGLAEHLQQIDGAMYGAYWCPACQQQKDLFGSAFKNVPYVECSPNGRGAPQAEACSEAGVQSYPTWIIEGQSYRGVRSLEALAEISGYEGPAVQ
jgi:uncharacterized membrane protein